MSSPPWVRRLAARDSGPCARRGRTLPRIARIGGIALVGAFALYLAAMNVFLRTRMFRRLITSDTGSLLVDYREAHSLWPGRIHVEDLVIRGRDGSVEWILTIGRCDFGVSFLELARRRFHASHVQGDGLSLRIRLRRDGPVSARTMRELPPVPGFPLPPMKDVGPPPPELTDANYNLWSIRLDDVDAKHVRELWIDTIRYAGDLEVTGRWFFRPLRWLEIGPATVSVQALDVSYGLREPCFSGAVGELTTTVHPFALQEVEGAAIVDRVSVDGDVRATVRTAHVLERLLGPDAPNSAVDRADDAALEAHVHLDHGVARSGTQLNLAPFSVAAHAGSLAGAGSATVVARVDGGDTTHVEIECSACGITHEASGGRAKRLAAAVDIPRVDMAHLGEPIDLSGNVDGDHLDVRLGAAVLTAPRVSLTATRWRVGGGQRAGELTVAADALSAEREDVGGNADSSARILFSCPGRTSGSIDLSGSELRLRDARVSVKGARVDVPALSARARSLAWIGSRPVGGIAVDAPSIELPLSAVPNALLMLPRIVSIEAGRARAQLSAEIELDELAFKGEAHVLTRGLRAHFGDQAVAGELRLDAQARERDGVTLLSGSTVTFEGTVGAEGNPWWARAELTDAVLDARGGLRLRARAAARAKSGAPLIAVLAQSTAIPAWVLKLVSTEGLVASGDLVVSPSTFQARSVAAHADGFDLGFELAELGTQSEWALLLDVGIVSAGVDGANGQTDVLLFGAKSWFEKKRASLRSIERRYE